MFFKLDYLTSNHKHYYVTPSARHKHYLIPELGPFINPNIKTNMVGLNRGKDEHFGQQGLIFDEAIVRQINKKKGDG